MTSKIYFYAQHSDYEDQIALGRIPMLKIGESLKQEVRKRIEQQDTTACSQPLICKGVWEVEGTDHEFHKWLISKGYKKTRYDKKREFFYITVEDAEFELRAWQASKQAKAEKVAETRTLMKHQEDFVIKILSNWKYWQEYLLSAKCRSGKSTMVLSAIVQSGVKVSLIMSFRNSPKQSWGKDILDCKNFENLFFIDIRDKNIEEVSFDIQKYLNADRQIVLYSTAQSGNRWSKLSCDIDLIIFDECHKGYRGKTWKTVCEKFSDAKKLYVSGTAHSMVDEFSDECRFIYNYFNEQYCKIQGIKGYENSPMMQLITFFYNSKKIKEIYGDDPDAIDNIWGHNKDKTEFNEPVLVDEFYNKVFVQEGFHFKKKLLNDTKHLMLRLPSIAACHLFAKYFTNSRFVPLVVTSDTNNNSVSINNHIEKYNSTAIITVDANVLGLTAEGIDTVMNCAGGESRENWIQFAFRGGSTNKESWKVIDFSSKRTFQEYQNSFLNACDTNDNLANSEYTSLNFANLVEYIDGYREVDQNRLNEILYENAKTTSSLSTGIISKLDLDKLKDYDFKRYQQSMEPSSRSVNCPQNDDNKDLNNKSNIQRKSTDTDKFPSQLSKTEINKKVETIKSYLERISLVIFHMIHEEYIPKTVNHILESKHYPYDTNDIHGDIQRLFDDGVFAKSLRKRIEQEITKIEYLMSKDKCEALQEFAITRKDQLPLNIEILDHMIPNPQFSNDTLGIECDPTGIHCLYAMKIGWKPENIYVWDDDSTHLYAIQQISGRINVCNYEDFEKMNFTASIGNPPYTDTSTVSGAVTGGCAKSLDTEFYLNAMGRSDYVSEVIRSNHFAKMSSKFRKTLFSTPGVVSIEALSNDTFRSIQMTETCIVTWKRGYNGTTRFKYLDGTVKEFTVTKDTCVRFTNPDFVSEVPNNLAYRYQRGSLNINQLIDGDCPMITTMGSKGRGGMITKGVSVEQHVCCVNQHGVVMNSKYGGNGLGQVYVKPYEYSISGSTIILKTSSEEESQKLVEYLKTPEVHSIVIKNRISNANTKEMFNTIPNLPI